jgi:CheY-like chemotaxis protein
LHLGQQVEELEKLAAIGRVVTGIADQLHNPLSDILEYIPIIAQCEMDSGARSIVDVVFTNAERAGHLVQNILIHAGTSESKHVAFDLNDIVRNVAVQRGASHSGPAFDIKLELERNLPRTMGYPSQIEQVITSLLVHAEDAIACAQQTHGTIHVHTGVRAGRIQVQVADNGQSRNSARISAPDSTGVGLNICAEIAKDHGGELYAWCAHGTGSTFTLELPACAEEAASTAVLGAGHSIRNRSVMVVDDEVHITELISDVLARHGALVQTTNSGADAYDLLYAKDFDLIICDQVMPGLSGESLFHLMAGTERSRKQRFLFMADEVITVQARQFFAETGVQYLRKPFRIQDLVEAVDGLFNQNPPLGF